MKLRAAFLGLLALAACEEEPLTGAGLYAAYCASCHGADARGGSVPIDGVVAPDLTVLAKNNRGVYPAVYVMATIDGYARDETHGVMPVFGGLLEEPIETWVDPDGVPTPTPRALILLNEYLTGQQVE